MKPFDLKRALAGDPVITRKGNQVEILTQLQPRPGFGDILAAVYKSNNKAELREIWKTGRYYGDEGENSVYDLFMAPIIKEGWINIYKDSSRSMYKYDTKESARKSAHNSVITTIKIKWEE